MEKSPFPSVTSAQKRQHEPDAALIDDTQIFRVLAAEDNPGNQLLISMLLKKLNCDYFIVNNGHEALKAVTDGCQFDLVLMDVHMPVMNGFDATRAIRALPGAPGKLPIIALTGDSLSDVRDEALHAGMNDLLGKPIDVRAFGAALAYWRGIAHQGTF